MLGVGTIYCDEKGPKLHIHTAIGKGDETVVGCPRGGASTFLVLEITIIEIAGIERHMAWATAPILSGRSLVHRPYVIQWVRWATCF